jgi:glycosyltransferase involved in cell wall biosynthesis
MRVLITADAVGGVWVYTQELVTGLVRRGVRVTLVSFGGIPTPEQTSWLRELPEIDFRPTTFRLEWMQDSADDLERSSEFLSAMVSEVNPELLHLNQYSYGSLPVDVPRLVVAHSDVVSWWVAVHGETPPASRWITHYREHVTRGLEHATAVVAPSRWMLDQILEHYIRPAQASVICNGRSPEQFEPNARKEDYMMSIGRLWDCGKQTDLLTKCELPMRTVVAGSDCHPDESFRVEVRGRSKTHVEFLGSQSAQEVRTLLSRASVYAATSCYEPFGLSPVEAALSRCAILANDIPTFRELWAENACYFRRNDPQSLAETAARLGGDATLRREYADRAYEHARQHYAAEPMVEQYLALYGSLTTESVAAA